MGVVVNDLEEIEPIRPVTRLFEQVWGRNEDGVPISSELLRSLVHAGGLVCAAYDDADRSLLGAAALGRAEPGACYSFIAAAAPGLADRGIGFLLKQHQRAWALGSGMRVMRWTFDPLTSRNARFNLVKLGAVSRDYHRAFYGRMSDILNGTDAADRLVAHWQLDSDRAERAAAGEAPDVGDPPGGARTLAAGPDGHPGYLDAGGERWLRVPTDVVRLRRADPEMVSQWRAATREWFVDAMSDGWVATGLSRTGWYQLTRLPADEQAP